MAINVESFVAVVVLGSDDLQRRSTQLHWVTIFLLKPSFKLGFRPNFGLKPNQHINVKWQHIRF